MRMRIAVAGVLGSMTLIGSALSAGLPESGTLDLLTDADSVISGTGNLAEAGWTVAPAGDVNGDGLADMLVGARLADPAGRKNAGSAYVVFGSKTPSNKIDLASLGAAGFRIDGAAPGDHASVALAPAGDLNGDGLGDVLIGAPGFDRPDAPAQQADEETAADTNSPKGAGAAYVVYGRRSGDVDLGSLDASSGFRVTGAAGGDEAGTALASLPDLNADGLPELVIGAPRHRSEPGDGEPDGAVYVVYGRAGDDVDLAAAFDGARYDGPPNGLAGVSVATSGDMNGDGVAEILVGAPRAELGAPNEFRGAGFVVFGSKRTGDFRIGSEDAPGFAVSGQKGSLTGVTAGSAGDLNADGRADAAFGGPLADNLKRPNAGSAYVVFGKSDTAPVDVSTLGDWGFRVDGVGDGDHTGSTVGSAGDFDADGRPDLLVGAATADPLSREDAGAGYVLRAQPPGTALDLASLQDEGIRLAGAHAKDLSRSVALVGDTDGDGRGDLLMGANRLKTGENERGGGANLVLAPHPAAEPPPADAGAVEEETLDKCFASNNVEAVLDDSGSMGSTDPLRLRKHALELILGKPRNEGKVLGAVEFGDTTGLLLQPEEIPSAGSKDAGRLLTRLDRQIRADNGGTDYNGAFGALADANVGATARIFLTDGGHNIGEYRDLHRGGPPTFVIGLGIGRQGPDAARLERIAKETEGRYFPAANEATLAPILDAIDSRLNCDLSLDHYVEPAIIEDELSTSDTELDDDAYSSDVSVNWDDAADDFAVEAIEVYDDEDDVVARVPARRIERALVRQGKGVKRRVVHAGPLTLTGVRGKAYIALRVRGLHGANRIRVKVRAKHVRDRARVSTHVAQSRRRR